MTPLQIPSLIPSVVKTRLVVLWEKLNCFTFPEKEMQNKYNQLEELLSKKPKTSHEGQGLL